MTRKTLPLGFLLYMVVALLMAVYFGFAAIQGNYGVFRRVEVMGEAQMLRAELDLLRAEVAAMENLTRRLSDRFLDLDLLDERARDVLGMIRTDEVVIR